MPLPTPPVRSLGAPPRAHEASPQWRDGRFRNRVPAEPIGASSSLALARDAATRRGIGRPTEPVPLAPVPDWTSPSTTLAATWFGHASVLVEVGGVTVLTDPVWSDRVSPSRRIGPRRLHPNPVPLDALPGIDVVAVSHDHYDHLDHDTVLWLDRHRRPTFAVPLGVRDHLVGWGISSDRIVELDWGDRHQIGDLSLTCTEAQHFSGRWLARDRTLWCSWVLEAGGSRVWFGGDTGIFDGLAAIGAEHGPFDLTLMPIGAYDPRWHDVHLDPEEAAAAHRMLQGDVLLPIHWATFDLAFHPWAEPIERLLAAAEEIRVATPRPGERVPLGSADPVVATEWWSTGQLRARA